MVWSRLWGDYLIGDKLTESSLRYCTLRFAVPFSERSNVPVLGKGRDKSKAVNVSNSAERNMPLRTTTKRTGVPRRRSGLRARAGEQACTVMNLQPQPRPRVSCSHKLPATRKRTAPLTETHARKHKLALPVIRLAWLDVPPDKRKGQNIYEGMKENNFEFLLQLRSQNGMCRQECWNAEL